MRTTPTLFIACSMLASVVWCGQTDESDGDILVVFPEELGSPSRRLSAEERASMRPDQSPYTDRHAVVLYKDVVDGSFNVQDFDVTLDGTLAGSGIPPDRLTFHWKQVSGPASGELLPSSSLTATFQNPKQGGVYRFRRADVAFGEANLVLPLAGANVDDFIADNLARADVFADKVLAQFSARARNDPFNGSRWFVFFGRGDYLGRPDKLSSRTVWYYNQVNSFTGQGAVGTWAGKPIRVAKLSNFMVAYTARRIGVSTNAAWVSQYIGTGNDLSATKSWDAGWSVGGGDSYGTTVPNLVADIWDDDNDEQQKNRKQWPNAEKLSNDVPPQRIQILMSSSDLLDFYTCQRRLDQIERRKNLFKLRS